jgi:hypothetical protein
MSWGDLNLYYSVFIGTGARSGVVLNALPYKPAGRGFDSRWVSLKFFSNTIFPVALWPWGRLNLTEMSTRCISWG